ncbi:MAG: hypothetical protein V1736_05370 [Pseudomonadota bacterium]
MNIGKRIRLQRIFASDGRALILDVDAGSHPVNLVSEALNAVDGIILSRGILNSAAKKPPHQIGLIIRIPGRLPLRYPADEERRILSLIEMAVRSAADAVAVSFESVNKKEERNSEWVSMVADVCEKWGLPIMLEAARTAGDPKASFSGPADLVCKAAEIGADFLSLSLKEFGAKFESKTEWPIPLLLVHLGGRKPDHDVFEFTGRAMESGAAGVVLQGISASDLERETVRLKDLAGLVHTTRAKVQADWNSAAKPQPKQRTEC